MEEELYFCRYHKYRLATFAEAEREVYSNDAYMERYMRGLLITHVLWANHRNPLIYYIETFLPALENDSGTVHQVDVFFFHPKGDGELGAGHSRCSGATHY